jgi:hypothetical protein
MSAPDLPARVISWLVARSLALSPLAVSLWCAGTLLSCCVLVVLVLQFSSVRSSLLFAENAIWAFQVQANSDDETTRRSDWNLASLANKQGPPPCRSASTFQSRLAGALSSCLRGFAPHTHSHWPAGAKRSEHSRRRVINWRVLSGGGRYVGAARYRSARLEWERARSRGRPSVDLLINARPGPCVCCVSCVSWSSASASGRRAAHLAARLARFWFVPNDLVQCQSGAQPSSVNGRACGRAAGRRADESDSSWPALFTRLTLTETNKHEVMR